MNCRILLTCVVPYGFSEDVQWLKCTSHDIQDGGQPQVFNLKSLWLSRG